MQVGEVEQMIKGANGISRTGLAPWVIAFWVFILGHFWNLLNNDH